MSDSLIRKMLVYFSIVTYQFKLTLTLIKKKKEKEISNQPHNQAPNIHF